MICLERILQNVADEINAFGVLDSLALDVIAVNFVACDMAATMVQVASAA